MVAGDNAGDTSTYSVDKFVYKPQDKPPKPQFMRVWKRCLFGRQACARRHVNGISRLYTSSPRPMPHR